MPSFDIIREVKPTETFRVSSVMGKFDLQSNSIKEHFKGEINLPENWQIGLIVGNSGTGKSTIAKELFPDEYITTFDYSAESVLDDMPKKCSVTDITKAFNSVGFSSPPSWLKPYAVLSNGEKMRVDLAHAILSEKPLFVFDEFTSVVDRNVAQIGSFAMQKAIRKTDKKFIAVGCHFDVIDWLMPDWVFNTNDMTFQSFEGQKKNKPKWNIKIYETKAKREFWEMFRKYHYLSHNHNNAARVFIMTFNDEICGFCSVLHFPHPHIKNLKKIHRLVILPDFQGLSVGIFFLTQIAKLFVSDFRITITTSAPSLVLSLKNNPDWKTIHIGRLKPNKTTMKSFCKTSSVSRITITFEYMG